MSKVLQRIKKVNKVKELKLEINWLFSYVNKYVFAILIYTVIGVIGTALSLFGSVMSKKLIDIVTGYDTGKIIEISVLMLMFGVGSIILSSISKRVSAYYGIVVQNEIQSDVYNKIMESDWESLNEFRSGDLLNRINSDVSSVSGSVIGFIPTLLIRITQFIGSFLIIVYYDYTMALIALVCVPVSAIVSRRLFQKMQEYNLKSREASSELMSFQDDSFQNMQSVKAFGIVEYFETQMKELQNTYKKIILDYNGIMVLTTSLMSFIAMMISYVTLGWGVYRLWTGAIVFGTLTLFMQLSGNLNSSFSALISLVPQLINTLAGATRILSVISLKSEDISDNVLCDVELVHDKEDLEIHIENMSFKYATGKKVLNNVSFYAKAGETIGIVGPTGEGKTTLIRILLGLVRIDEGSAEIVKGNNRINISAATRKLFSYVPQENTVFAGTIKENMILGNNKIIDEDVVKALKSACAWEFVSKLPNAENSVLKESGKGISEGQAQRIAIARALVKDAPIILMDESTSALDGDTEMKILENIFKENSNKICIMVTHRPSVLSICNRVYKIQNGDIIELID